MRSELEALAIPGVEARFDAGYARGKDSECWEWTGTCNQDGYGRVSVLGEGIAVHRLSFARANGAIPKRRVVRHSCDNPPCVNPAHLLLGTVRDNVYDSMERGRKFSILTEADVSDIKTRLALPPKRGRVSAIAREYGVSHSLISMIRSGKRRELTLQERIAA